MSRTRGRGRTRGLRKSRKKGRGRRSTLRGRTKNMRGGLRTCFSKGTSLKPYLVDNMCWPGSTDEDDMIIDDRERKWTRWYQSPEQINLYSPKDQERIKNNPDFMKLFSLQQLQQR